MIEIMNIARKIEPEHDRLVVAVALYGRTPFIGWNSRKTSPEYRRTYSNGDVSYSRHAELHALSQLPHDADRRKVILYVARLAGRDALSMAKPCKDCQDAIKREGVKKVFYTDWDGNWTRLHA